MGVGGLEGEVAGGVPYVGYAIKGVSSSKIDFALKNKNKA